MHPQQSPFMDPGFTLAAHGPDWFDIDGSGYVYGQFVIVNDADSGDYEQFYFLPEPDPLAGESALVRLLATDGHLGAQYPQQYFNDPRILQRLREVENYLRYAQRLTGRDVDWREAINRAWWLQVAMFGPWSTFDDAGQTALKIIAQSDLPNAQSLSDAIRATRSFQEGQAAMARAWEESNKASNLFTTAREIAGDVATLASSGGFRIIMLPFAVTGALNLANNLAQNGLTETIRQTAQSAANTLNNALSFAQSADAATVAAEQAAQAAQAAQSAVPDIFLETDIGMAEALANPSLPVELFTAPPPAPESWPDVFTETDAGMREALANPVLPPEVIAPEPLNVFQETDAGMREALESGGQLPPDFVPATPYTPPPAPTTPATTAATAAATGTGAASVLTTAANAIKAGAGILALTMGAGGSTAPRPGIPLQPGQVIATGQPQPFTGAAFPWYILIPAAALLLARKG